MNQPRPSLADLYEIKPALYWTDLLLSAGVGWAAFVLAANCPVGSLMSVAGGLVAIFALNRAATFTHEISHQHRRLPGFEAAWNWLVGFPLLIPSFAYGQVHLDHHRVAIYGTKNDPSYLPFARSAPLTTIYLLHTLIAPVFLILRFLVLAPIGLFSKRLELWLVEYASAISFNPNYRREASITLLRNVRQDTWLLLTFWSVLIITIVIFANGERWGALFPGARSVSLEPWVLLGFCGFWYMIMASINLLEALRTLVEHSYESSGEPMDRDAQIADSNDIPGGLWTELWAPLGLRYHATHHAFPGIPYYVLPRAYRRLAASMPDYKKMTRPGLLWTLSHLYRKGLKRN